MVTILLLTEDGPAGLTGISDEITIHNMEIVIGLILVTLAGLGTGTVVWPMKKIKDLHFEQYMFVFMFSSVLLFPWIVTLINVPHLSEIIKRVGWKPLLISNLLSIGWGIANILYYKNRRCPFRGNIVGTRNVCRNYCAHGPKRQWVIPQCSQPDVKCGNFYYGGAGGCGYRSDIGHYGRIWKGESIK